MSKSPQFPQLYQPFNPLYTLSLLCQIAAICVHFRTYICAHTTCNCISPRLAPQTVSIRFSSHSLAQHNHCERSERSMVACRTIRYFSKQCVTHKCTYNCLRIDAHNPSFHYCRSIACFDLCQNELLLNLSIVRAQRPGVPSPVCVACVGVVCEINVLAGGRKENRNVSSLFA
jgi:hypothetical protein